MQKLAQALKPVMRRLFPDVPPEHPAMGAMVLNMAANMLGLGNAATPLGLRAMAHLERLNPRPQACKRTRMCTLSSRSTRPRFSSCSTSAIEHPGAQHSEELQPAIVPTAFLATVLRSVLAGVTIATAGSGCRCSAWPPWPSQPREGQRGTVPLPLSLSQKKAPPTSPRAAARGAAQALDPPHSKQHTRTHTRFGSLHQPP